jgi:hypothetical protein
MLIAASVSTAGIANRKFFMARYTPAALFLAYCLLLALASEPRRVGDGVEYWAMAQQLRLRLPPSASHGELIRLEREAQAIGHGFEQSPVRFPGLVGRDGRQDFPHFWLYPLVNVPALTLVSTLGLHPNWAFTLTNILLLTLAFAIVWRSASLAWALLLAAGPIVWWIDKVHGDVFTVSMLAIGCALWQTAPAWTVVTLAAAAAQNPALMPVSAFVSLAALWRQRDQPRRILPAVIIGVLFVALPLAYYKSRLGVWSPLMGYTQPGLPPLRRVLSLLLDPNIGLIPNVPFLIAAALIAMASPSETRWRDRTIAGIACLLLLAAFAQSVNVNHGATPGLNRWTLWLAPWLLLMVATRQPPYTNRARIVLMLAMMNTVWSAWYFRPSLPEVYRYPTASATWLWSHAPHWYLPAPEVFAERVSHREPAYLPVALPGCATVLIVDGRWPAACPQVAAPPADCLGPSRICYATSAGTFTPLGDASFPWYPADDAVPAFR